MADIFRHFTSDRTFFVRNRRYHPGDVIPFPADACQGRARVKGEVVKLDKPSRYLTETDSGGKPLDGSAPVKHAVPAGALDAPVTMSEARAAAASPGPSTGPNSQKPKRPSDRDI